MADQIVGKGTYVGPLAAGDVKVQVLAAISAALQLERVHRHRPSGAFHLLACTGSRSQCLSAHAFQSKLYPFHSLGCLFDHAWLNRDLV